MTYTQIAELAGVSEPTVSRVINGTGGVSAEKQQKVAAVLKQLNIPMGPRRKRSHSIVVGLLLLDGVEFDAQAAVTKINILCGKLPKKWELVLLNYRDNRQKVMSGIIRKELDGLFISGFGKLDEELKSYIDRIPHIWLNSHTEEPGTVSLNISGNELAGRFGARYLIESGCKFPAVISGKSINPGLPDRVNGFAFECFANKVKYKELFLEDADTPGIETASDEQLNGMMTALFRKKSRRKIDGIFFVEARLAAYFYRTKSRLAPEMGNIRTICGGSSADCISGLYPRPAYINLSPDMVAEMAMEKLFNLIEKRGSEAAAGRTVVFTPRLIPGDPI